MAKKPDAAEALQDLYKNLPKDELERQGREFLEGKADERAHRAARIARIALWSAGIGVVLLGGAFCLWLLFKAKESGRTFGEMKREAMKAYVDSDE